MIVETLAGSITVTRSKRDADKLALTSASRDTLVSVLNGVELIGGALGEDEVLDPDELIVETNNFGKLKFTAQLTPTQYIRYLEYEVLNFMNYTSLTEMRKMR